MGDFHSVVCGFGSKWGTGALEFGGRFEPSGDCWFVRVRHSTSSCHVCNSNFGLDWRRPVLPLPCAFNLANYLCRYLRYCLYRNSWQESLEKPRGVKANRNLARTALESDRPTQFFGLIDVALLVSRENRVHGRLPGVDADNNMHGAIHEQTLRKIQWVQEAFLRYRPATPAASTISSLLRMSVTTQKIPSQAVQTVRTLIRWFASTDSYVHQLTVTVRSEVTSPCQHAALDRGGLEFDCPDQPESDSHLELEVQGTTRTPHLTEACAEPHGLPFQQSVHRPQTELAVHSVGLGRDGQFQGQNCRYDSCCCCCRCCCCCCSYYHHVVHCCEKKEPA